jgi:hypothetical protein
MQTYFVQSLAHQLESSGNNFKRNQTDVFGFDCVDLGDLTKIAIRHDNSVENGLLQMKKMGQ